MPRSGPAGMAQPADELRAGHGGVAMPGREALTFELEASEGADVVRFGGELDLTTLAGLDEAVGRTTARIVILDLTGIEFVDSAGLHAIDRVNRLLAAGRRRLLLVAPPDSRAGWTLRVAGFGDGLALESVERARALADDR